MTPTHYESFGKGMDRDVFKRARQFDAQNPQVWELFVRFSMQARDSGRKYMGAKCVIERMRWYSNVETTGDEFVLNNSHTAYYARKFTYIYPHLEGFFRIRTTPLGA